MTWRVDKWIDDEGRIVESHVVPEPNEAGGWDGVADDRPRQYSHWHQRTNDAHRTFYEIPHATAETIINLLELDTETHSFHDALAVIELRLR